MPPYCGTPRLSHQFPVLVVVAVTVVAADVVDVVVDVIAAVVVVVATGGVVVVVVVVVVDDLQDAKISDSTIRKVSNPQKALFFIYTSFFILRLLDN